MARRIDSRPEGRHLQKPGDARGARGLQHAPREIDVRAAKAGAAKSALVEDADQVDHDVLAAKLLAQLRFIVDVAIARA